MGPKKNTVKYKDKPKLKDFLFPKPVPPPQPIVRKPGPRPITKPKQNGMQELVMTQYTKLVNDAYFSKSISNSPIKPANSLNDSEKKTSSANFDLKKVINDELIALNRKEVVNSENREGMFSTPKIFCSPITASVTRNPVVNSVTESIASIPGDLIPYSNLMGRGRVILPKGDPLIIKQAQTAEEKLQKQKQADAIDKQVFDPVKMKESHENIMRISSGLQYKNLGHSSTSDFHDGSASPATESNKKESISGKKIGTNLSSHNLKPSELNQDSPVKKYPLRSRRAKKLSNTQPFSNFKAPSAENSFSRNSTLSPTDQELADNTDSDQTDIDEHLMKLDEFKIALENNGKAPKTLERFIFNISKQDQAESEDQSISGESEVDEDTIWEKFKQFTEYHPDSVDQIESDVEFVPQNVEENSTGDEFSSGASNLSPQQSSSDSTIWDNFKESFLNNDQQENNTNSKENGGLRNEVNETPGTHDSGLLSKDEFLNLFNPSNNCVPDSTPKNAVKSASVEEPQPKVTLPTTLDQPQLITASGTPGNSNFLAFGTPLTKRDGFKDPNLIDPSYMTPQDVDNFLKNCMDTLANDEIAVDYTGIYNAMTPHEVLDSLTPQLNNPKLPSSVNAISQPVAISNGIFDDGLLNEHFLMELKRLGDNSHNFTPTSQIHSLSPNAPWDCYQTPEVFTSIPGLNHLSRLGATPSNFQKLAFSNPKYCNQFKPLQGSMGFNFNGCKEMQQNLAFRPAHTPQPFEYPPLKNIPDIPNPEFYSLPGSTNQPGDVYEHQAKRLKRMMPGLVDSVKNEVLKSLSLQATPVVIEGKGAEEVNQNKASESNTSEAYFSKYSPLIHSSSLSQKLGCNVLLKLENTNLGGSHKSRGMLKWLQNVMLNYCGDGLVESCEILCSGSPNRCIAMATAVHHFLTSFSTDNNKGSLSLTVYAPKNVSELFKTKVKMFDANLILVGKDWEESASKAEVQLKHPSANDSEGSKTVIEAPATIFGVDELLEGMSEIGTEICHQIRLRNVNYVDLAAVIVPTGTGGLLHGVIKGLESSTTQEFSKVPIISVETKSSQSLSYSLEQKRVVEWTGYRGAKRKVFKIEPSTKQSQVISLDYNIDPTVFQLALQREVKPLVVSSKEACLAAINFSEDHNFIIEPASAVALSPIYSGDLKTNLPNLTPNSTVVVVITGGNMCSLEDLIHYKEKRNKLESKRK